MTEPDPKPQTDATAVANGSGPSMGSGAEKVAMNKNEEGKISAEKADAKEDNTSLEGKHDAPQMQAGKGKNAVEKDEHVKESNGTEETKENKDKDGIKEINVVEEIKEEEVDKSSVKDPKDEEEMNKVESEKKNLKEKKDGVDEMIGEGATEGSEVKKEQEGKMDIDTKAEDQEEGKGAKEIHDVEMAESEGVKEEEKAISDERIDEGPEKEERDGVKEGDNGKEDGSKKTSGLKWKRSRSGRKVSEKGEGVQKKWGERKDIEAKDSKGGSKKPAEPLMPLSPSSIDRPVRDRKTVERLVEVIEKETNKGVVIEKGRGTPLKNIPNVANRLARKKPGDLKLLHQMLFGRKGKAVDFKNHILQFSGFTWHESDDKQRAKVKERLDRCVKDSLLDLCYLLDIIVPKANSRKEDVITMLLDFMAAPHATTDMIADKGQPSPKSQKHKSVSKGSISKGNEGRSKKKQIKIEDATSSGEESPIDSEDEDVNKQEKHNGKAASDEGEELGHAESEKENDANEAHEKNKDEIPDKGIHGKKQSPKKQISLNTEKVKRSSSKKTPSVAAAKSSTRISSSANYKSDEINDLGEKVFVRKKKNVDPPKAKASPKADLKEKSSGKRGAGGKTKLKGLQQSNPSKEDLRKAICETLKKVDLNMATFTDIFKQLATHYETDLTSRKTVIKQIIQEELTKLADDEAEENEDEGDSEKEELPEPKRKKLKV